jgi:hypothetical protein
MKKVPRKGFGGHKKGSATRFENLRKRKEGINYEDLLQEKRKSLAF